MPLYEYECSVCHHRFEKIESFSAPAEQQCPKCGETAKRLLAAPAIQFKGSGWYVTDYARKSSSDSASTSEHKTSKPASGDGAGGDKKPAAEKPAAQKKSGDGSS